MEEKNVIEPSHIVQDQGENFDLGLSKEDGFLTEIYDKQSD